MYDVISERVRASVSFTRFRAIRRWFKICGFDSFFFFFFIKYYFSSIKLQTLKWMIRQNIVTYVEGLINFF